MVSCSINTYTSLIGHHPTVNGFSYSGGTPGLWFFFVYNTILASLDNEIASNSEFWLTYIYITE